MKVLITGGSGNLGRYVVEEMKGKHDVTVFDMKEPFDRSVKLIKGDILNLQTLKDASKDFEVIVHLAAIPAPDRATHDVVFNVNVMGTFNVLESAYRNKVRRVVIASSDSTLGFLFRVTPPLMPEYLPIDENHPLKAEDPYGLSKVVDEQLCWMYTRRTGLETVCLRICYVWFPNEYRYGNDVGTPQGYKGLVDNPDAWWQSLWVYQDARDAAQAFRLGAEVPGLKHERFFISADDNGTRVDSLELIKKYYPSVKKVDKSKLKGRASLICTDRAKKILGYRPKYSWKDIIGEK